MSWLPLLLAAWVLVDLFVVLGIVAMRRRASTRAPQGTLMPRLLPTASQHPRSPQVSGRPTSRLVH